MCSVQPSSCGILLLFLFVFRAVERDATHESPNFFSGETTQITVKRPIKPFTVLFPSVALKTTSVLTSYESKQWAKPQND